MADILDRTVAPAFKPINPVNIQQAETYTLDNGVPVYYINAGNTPVVSMDIVFDAGCVHDGINGQSFFTLKMLQEGTKGHTASQIADTFALFGAYTDINHSADRVIFTVHTLNKFLPSVLPLVNELLSQATLPAEQLEKQKTIQSQSLEVNLQKTGYLASVKFREQLFGASHPYGHSLSVSEIAAIQQPSLQSFYQQHYTHSPFQVIIAGKVGQAELSLLNNVLGSRPVNVVPVTPLAKTALPLAGTYIANKEGSQSSLRMGYPTIQRSHNDFAALRVVNEILGGYFGSRLMANIREDKGYTYGIHSSLVSMTHAAYFVIGTDVKIESTQATIDEVYKEIAILRRQPVSPDELELVRNYMLGTFANSITTPFSLADKFKTVHFSGLDYSYFTRYINTIKSITPEQILETAQTYLKPEEMVVAIGGAL